MQIQNKQQQVAAQIAARNDVFRTQVGRCTITCGVGQLAVTLDEVLLRVKHYKDFTDASDPYQEHDFGVFELAGERIFWKIDYYDESMTHWCDPLDERCTRHLTIMLAEEY